MRAPVSGWTFLAVTVLATANTGTAEAGNCGLFPRHNGCGHANKNCSCCDETVVIHCYPDSKKGQSRDTQFSNNSQPVGNGASLIPYQSNFGMPMMPMMGVMPVGGFTNNSFGNNSQPVGNDRCNDGQMKRIEQLETDFKNLTKHVDEITVAVDRNTFAIEKLIAKLSPPPGNSEPKPE